MKEEKEKKVKMKIYNKRTKEIRWEDDVSPMLEDIWMDITEILA